MPAVDAQLAFPCCCCTPPAVPPETTNTHHYSILVHISQHNNNNGNNTHFSFTNLFFSLTFLIIILSYFRPIYSPSGHHEFNFDHSLFFFFLKIKTHFTKGEKTNSTLNTVKFHCFIDLAETANKGGSLTSP